MDVYGSYTCVGASDSVTDELKVELGPDKVGKLGFKTFNIKVQPPSPEINAGSYNIVIPTELFRWGAKCCKDGLLRVGNLFISIEFTGTSL